LELRRRDTEAGSGTRRFAQNCEHWTEVRAGLVEEALEVALAEGRALTLEQMIE
jgi:hypothetical protein